MPEVTYSFDRDADIATMTIDTAGAVNTIGHRFITDLERAIESALRDQPRGVMLISGKRRSFLDGANLQQMLSGETPKVVRLMVLRFQEVVASLAKTGFPVVALLDNQTALGGGFELLLWACDHVFTTPGSRMGLPETSLGLFPSGGAAQTLPLVVGFESAVDMIMNARVGLARNLKSPGFFTVCESDQLRSSAATWINEHQGVVNRNYDPEYEEPHPLSQEEKLDILDAARERFTVCRYRLYYKAALEALEAGLNVPFDEAVKSSADLFVPLVFSPYTRNKIDLFFLSTGIGPKLVKVSSPDDTKTDSIAVIGAGLMGQGIAQIAADRGTRVILVDVDEETVRASVETVGRTLEALVSRGKWAEDRKARAMEHIQPTTDYAQLEDVPLIIECVFEDLSLKQEILARVQEVNPEAVFASNTSTLPMADIARGSARPEQVVGMHYFSPVPLMPLLEVVQGEATSQRAVATAVSAGRSMGKTVILVGDGPGFYTSRTFGAYVMNGLRLAELGMSPWEVDRIALRGGFPQGPLHVYGTTGGKVIYYASRLMSHAFPERIAVPKTLEKLHDAGYVGAGRPCFYLDNRKMTPDESALEHVEAVEGLPVPTPGEAEDILLLGMINEAFWCLSDEVLFDYYSMDLGATLGIGFPDCLHGPARYVSQRGIKTVHARLEDLKEKFHLSALDPAPEFDFLMACGLDSSLI